MDLIGDYGSDSEGSTGNDCDESSENTPPRRHADDTCTSASEREANEPSRSLLECSDEESSSGDEDEARESGADGDSKPDPSQSGRISVTAQAGHKTSSKSSESVEALPLPDLQSFVPSGEAAIFKPAQKGMYEADNLPGVKRLRPGEDEPEGFHHDSANAALAYNTRGLHQGYMDGPGEECPREEADDPKAKRRKRHGVTDTLLPPKRAVQQLRNQIHQDQPWMRR